MNLNLRLLEIKFIIVFLGVGSSFDVVGLEVGSSFEVGVGLEVGSSFGVVGLVA